MMTAIKGLTSKILFNSELFKQPSVASAKHVTERSPGEPFPCCGVSDTSSHSLYSPSHSPGTRAWLSWGATASLQPAPSLSSLFFTHDYLCFGPTSPFPPIQAVLHNFYHVESEKGASACPGIPEGGTASFSL